MRILPSAVAWGILLPGALASVAALDPPPKPVNFSVARIHLERNLTDGDAEVVLEAVGGECGLRKLSVSGPDGKAVATLASPEAGSLGSREIVLESPEPAVAKVFAAYPEGSYRFTGESTCDESLTGSASLSHTWPEASRVVSPAAGAVLPAGSAARIEWAAVPGVKGYRLEVEQPGSGVEVEAKLPAAVTHYVLPADLLLGKRRLQVGIGTVDTAGNVTFVEVGFKISVPAN